MPIAAFAAPTVTVCNSAWLKIILLLRKQITGAAYGQHAARVLGFVGCALLCALCALVPWLGPGPWLLITLGLAGAGALGVFPLYHAFTQDISSAHQGKITGMAGVAGWLIPAGFQTLFGKLADSTGSFDLGLALAGFLPLLAVIPLWLIWKPVSEPSSSQVH